MTTELPKPDLGEQKPARGRSWAGVIFSLLVPGFGIARGGHFGRAVAWLLGLELGMVVAVFCLALQEIPFALGLAAAGCWWLGFLAMLYKSYIPGRMDRRLWPVFIALFAFRAFVGSPAQLVVHPFKMPTGSMAPTLQGASGKGDHVFVDRLTYRFSPPRRGDLLVFLTQGISGLPQDQVYVKRIVGMPGEQIDIHEGCVFANGTRLTEREGIPPIRYTAGVAGRVRESGSTASYKVPQESYFVVGDNPDNSLDSRYFGAVPLANVYGKVTAIYYPFSRAGRPRYPGKPDIATNRSKRVDSQTNQPSSPDSGR